MVAAAVVLMITPAALDEALRIQVFGSLVGSGGARFGSGRLTIYHEAYYDVRIPPIARAGADRDPIR